MLCAERGWRAALRAALLPALMMFAPAPAWAHKPSDSYLVFKPQAQELGVRWDIALRDLDTVLELDANGDRSLTWGEVKAAWPAIEAYALKRLVVPGCEWRVDPQRALEKRGDGVYAVLTFSAACALTREGAIGYSLLAEVDATHRGIARVDHADGSTEVRLLDPTAPASVASTTQDAAKAGSAEPPASFFAEGVHHIVTGYDHLLFLLCLLLPAVLRRGERGWGPVENWREAFLPVLGIVTLFTVAHSITLALAALGIFTLPGWFVEPAIALTIAVAALDNLRPIFGRARAFITFGFGLIHGFGFAGVLAELELPAATFGWALLKFNLGLEAGQIVIVATVVPLLYLGRARGGYQRWVLQAGSATAIVIALGWFVQRIVPLLNL